MNADRTEQLAGLEIDATAWRRYAVKASLTATGACLLLLLANGVEFSPEILNIAISGTFSAIAVAFACFGLGAYVMSRRTKRAIALLRGQGG